MSTWISLFLYIFSWYVLRTPFTTREKYISMDDLCAVVIVLLFFLMYYAGDLYHITCNLLIKRIIIHWLITRQLYGTWIFQGLYKLIIYLHQNEAIGFAFVLIYHHTHVGDDDEEEEEKENPNDVMCSLKHTMRRNYVKESEKLKFCCCGCFDVPSQA